MSPVTLLILLPFLGALGILLTPAKYARVWHGVAVGSTGLALVVALFVFFGFVPGTAGYQMVDSWHWSEAVGLSYHVGVDGLNVGLLLVTALVGFAAACVSSEIERQPKLFHILLLVMVGGALGAFASLDLFFLYFFNELALVPTFLMIGIWGRGEQKAYAAFQITLYLSLGALVALIGLVCLYALSGANTLDVVTLSAWLRQHPLPAAQQTLIFGLLLFGFGTLVGLFPFHSWAPLGYGVAPTATAMMHAGILKKVGLFALLRAAFPLLPEGVTAWTHVLSVLCLGNLLYCGWVAMKQRDLNLLFGNSSLAHMGVIFLGLASVSVIGVTGAVLIMIAHALLAALEFALSGYLYRQTRTLELSKLGGALRQLPFIGAVLVAALLAGCGVPGFANFAGEITVMFGAWKTLPWHVVAAAWGGLIIGAVYMLRAVRQIAHGEVSPILSPTTDAGPLARIPYALLLVALLLFGVAPHILVDRIKPSVEQLVKLARSEPAAPPTPAVALVSPH
ncbi:MAG TPA: NADH-quinone oxidoreductase subunit M [Verrucomicrobiota bacterium]|nr:proton-translocating NADH-quinone oxidoreductase subunit M [Verrucomicrobiales bacterium]HRI13968.1 NADH-quinone oxidoreductase subunit M [Verrucomicrobiota bacterium]